MSDAERPERTREHYIEALGRNHVERFVFLQGHAVDEPRSDYGCDLVITTFDYIGDASFQSGKVENGFIFIQLKSTEHLKIGKRDSKKISFSIKRRHVVYWIDEPLPVILIVYSVPDNKAYWLHVQPYLKSSAFRMPPRSQEEVVVHLSTDNVVNESAIETFRQSKINVLRSIERLRLYG